MGKDSTIDYFPAWCPRGWWGFVYPAKWWSECRWSRTIGEWIAWYSPNRGNEKLRISATPIACQRRGFPFLGCVVPQQERNVF